MQPIYKDKFEKMTLEEKIYRMDLILAENHKEKFPPIADNIPFFKVQNIVNTKAFQDHEDKQKLAWMCFEFLLQGEYLYTYFGMINGAVYNDRYRKCGWTLRHHFSYNALTQAIITGSRIQEMLS